MLKTLLFCSIFCLFACKSVILNTEKVVLPSDEYDKLEYSYISTSTDKKKCGRLGFIFRTNPTQYSTYFDTVNVKNHDKIFNSLRYSSIGTSYRIKRNIFDICTSSKSKQDVVLFSDYVVPNFINFSKEIKKALFLKNDTFLVLKLKKVTTNAFIEKEYRNRRPFFLAKNEHWFYGENWTNFTDTYASGGCDASITTRQMEAAMNDLGYQMNEDNILSRKERKQIYRFEKQNKLPKGINEIFIAFLRKKIQEKYQNHVL